MTKRCLLLLTLPAAGLSSPILAQPVGPEFQVNTYTFGYQEVPSVASDAAGNFVVVWSSTHQLQGLDIFGQRYDSSGSALGAEFQVNTHTRGDQLGPSVASDASGNFVVIWKSKSEDGDGFRVAGQRYDSSGNPLGAEFQVNTYTTKAQHAPSVASDATGNFVVVWNSSPGIVGQRYDSSGSPLGGEFQVNTYTPDVQGYTSIASDASGNFVVVWDSYDQDGFRDGVFGQRYDNSGNRLGDEFRVNTYTTHSQRCPSIASDVNGNFVVVWDSEYQDGSVDGVFGQRFLAPCEKGPSWQQNPCPGP